ncbi:hypothetical protein DSL72_007819 [Monilinia vaccinii-corymbosi]|uniref:Uncharacterized protein n=1 Tax=Monilinia vaccinii-corymbosi TaxID=61207 RepID=A0A8A3PI01_9HELO|nr:hypothetical protein DSL72_007819 [Monilinia vaccinii-corymbosi]
MADKHEFDVSVLLRCSPSPESAGPRQPMDVDNSRLPSPPPPPYPAQGESFLGSSDINSTYSLNVVLKSSDLSPPDQPFKNVSASTSPTSSTVVTYHPNLSSRFPGQRAQNVVNRILELNVPPTNSRIMSRRNRGNFKSELWETPERTNMFAASQSSKTRRYHSRTFPADASTQPYLEECYPQPYGSISCPPSPPPAGHENLQSTKDLSLKLENFEINLHTLHLEIEGITREYNMLLPLLPKSNDGLYSTIDASIWGPRERMAYKRTRVLENRRLNILKEIEVMERNQKPIYEEWNRRREAREPFQHPLKIIAKEIKERDLGRKWLRGEIPWADAVNMGRGLPRTTNSVDMMRRLSC